MADGSVRRAQEGPTDERDRATTRRDEPRRQQQLDGRDEKLDGACSKRDGMLNPGDVALFRWYFTERQSFDGIFRRRRSFDAMRPIFPLYIYYTQRQ